PRAARDPPGGELRAALFDPARARAPAEGRRPFRRANRALRGRTGRGIRRGDRGHGLPDHVPFSRPRARGLLGRARAPLPARLSEAPTGALLHRPLPADGARLPSSRPPVAAPGPPHPPPPPASPPSPRPDRPPLPPARLPRR